MKAFLVNGLIFLVVTLFIFQLYQVYLFINSGPRFTASDGQALCLRVAALEKQLLQEVIPCNYVTEPRHENQP